MKKLKLSLIALPFAALLFAGCDVPGAPKSEDEPSIENNLGNNGENGGGQNNNGGNNNGGGNHQETEIERVVRIVV